VMTAMRAVTVAATQTAANIAAAARHEMPDQHCEARGHRDDIDDVESVHFAPRSMRRMISFDHNRMSSPVERVNLRNVASGITTVSPTICSSWRII
jgi:hypothetical protein